MKNAIRTQGVVTFELRGPDGKLKDRRVVHNLVTDVGDIYFSQLPYGTKVAAALNSMMLGSYAAEAAKSGDGSFIGAQSYGWEDYINASNHAVDASSPKAGASANICLWQHTWAAGEVVSAAINRVALLKNVDSVTNTGEASAANTWAIALLPDKPINKVASDTLLVTWNITFLGA